MKLENIYPIAKQIKQVKDALPAYQVTAGRIETIKERIDITKHCIEQGNDKLQTINISTCIIEVTSKQALELLETSLQAENETAKLYSWRLDKALSYLSGEFDSDMEE